MSDWWENERAQTNRTVAAGEAALNANYARANASWNQAAAYFNSGQGGLANIRPWEAVTASGQWDSLATEIAELKAPRPAEPPAPTPAQQRAADLAWWHNYIAGPQLSDATRAARLEKYGDRYDDPPAWVRYRDESR